MGLAPIRIKIIADTTGAERSYDELTRAQRGLDTATDEYTRTLLELDRAEKSGLVSKTRVNKLIEETATKYKRQTVAAAATVGATTKLTRGFGGLASASKTTRSRIQQTSFQLQDIIVQLQGGTSATTALSQQLPQLAGAFGAAGAALGVGLALGIPAVSAAMTLLRGESKELDDVLEDLADAMGEYKDAADLADLSTGQLREQFVNLTPGIVVATEALRDFADDEVRRNIADLSKSLTDLLGVGGAGEAKSNIADFFDVNIFLAFTTAARESRTEARKMTAEFVNSQIAIEAAGDDLNAQSIALARLLKITQSLANASGDVNEEESKLIKQISDAVLATEHHKAATTETTNETNLLVAALESAGTVASNIAIAAGLMEDPISRAASAARELLDNLASTASIIGGAAFQKTGGRGGDPRDFGLGPEALPLLTGFGGEFIARDKKKPTRDTGDDPLEQLIEDLKTETEIVNEFFAESLILLQNANEAELEVLGGFHEAKERLEAEHIERLSGIKKSGREFDLQTVLGGTADILAAVGQRNEKALKISKAFAAAEALVSTYQGAAKELAKGTFGFAAAAAVIAQGAAFIATIQGASAGSGGGGGSTPSAAPAAGTALPPSEITITGTDLNQFARVGDIVEPLQVELRSRGLTLVTK